MSSSSSKRTANPDIGEEKEHYSDHFYGLPLSTYYTVRRVVKFLLFLAITGFGTIWFINFFERNYEAIERNPLSLFSSGKVADITDWNLPASETAELSSQSKFNSPGSNSINQQSQETTKSKTYKEITQEKIRLHYEQLRSTRPELTLSPPANEKQLPFESLQSIIERWNPDNPNIPVDFKERLQHFDYSKPEERALAAAYRDAELPFKLFNVPEFNDISLKWDDTYLNNNLNSIQGRVHVEKSNTNHFMFWAMRGFRSVPNYKPPTELISSMTFQEWLSLAHLADRHTLEANKTHFYFMTGADARENGRTFISRDLSLFSTRQANFFITNPSANKGIQCRFGMRGVIAECHYDSGKNMITMLKGAKRYIITPPRTCPKLGIIADVKHPSYRHSVIDWSDLSQGKQAGFDDVDAIDTIVHMGEILYVPSFWFHYIISLEYSVQCNSRSGFPKNMIGQTEIKECLRTTP